MKVVIELIEAIGALNPSTSAESSSFDINLLSNQLQLIVEALLSSYVEEIEYLKATRFD